MRVLIMTLGGKNRKGQYELVFSVVYVSCCALVACLNVWELICVYVSMWNNNMAVIVFLPCMFEW
jgi:hypothetical protein